MSPVLPRLTPTGPTFPEHRTVRTIAIINQKGGCGKTTTAINLAGVFSRSGLRTLLVDLDPQAHCAAGLAIPEQRIDVQIGDAMLAEDDQAIDWTRLLWRVSRNLDLAPSTVRLAGLESLRGGLAALARPELRLTSVLSRVADQYDVCLLDCPPSIGLLTYNGLAAATEILIPVETGFFSLQGAAKQVSTIKALGKKLGVMPPYRLLATMHNPDSTLARDLLDELRTRFEAKVIPVVVRFDVALREAVSFGQPVVEYAPHSTGAEDYRALASWLVDHADAQQPTSFNAAPVRSVSSPVTVTSTAASALLSPVAPPTVAPIAPAGPAAELKVEPKPASTADLLAARLAGMAALAGRVNQASLSASGTTITPPTSALAHPASTPVNTAAPAPNGPTPSILTRAAELAARAQALAAQLNQREQSANVPSSGTVLITGTGPGGLPTMADLALARAAAVARVSTAAAVAGARCTTQGVLFVQPGREGQTIAVAGDFNAWSATSHMLRFNPDLSVYELCVPLPPGRHSYRLVIDGKWTNDPHNPVAQPNPFGELNSIVEVIGELSLV